MSNQAGKGVGGAVVPANQADARLRKATSELEGVFLLQILKAMRNTVPEGGIMKGAMAEDMFLALLDQHLGALAAGRAQRGVGAPIYRYFRALSKR